MIDEIQTFWQNLSPEIQPAAPIGSLLLGALVGGHYPGAVGAVVYALAVLIVLLIAADAFDWPLTRSTALALWQLTHHLLVAGAALFIGCFGARWAREMVTAEGAASPEKRASQYTALGI